MFIRRPVLALCLLLSGRAAVAAEASRVDYAAEVRPVAALTEYFVRFVASARAGNGDGLPAVSPDFTSPHARITDPEKFFPLAVARLGRGLDRLTIEAVDETAAGRAVRVTLHFGEDRVERNFAFDPQERLRSADFIFDSRTPTAAPGRVRMPPRVELPFELRNNLPFVEAEVDGQRGLFIFDTGASRITLNDKYFSALQKPGEIAVARGARGEDAARRARVGKFSLGGYEVGDFECALADLSTLERNGQIALGLIGYEALKNFEVAFDYERRVVVLYALDAAGATLAPHDFGPAGFALPFTQEGHLPVIEATIAGQPVRLALDSGAGGGTLDLSARARLGAALASRGMAMLGGMGGMPVQREMVFGDLQVGELAFPGARFVCNDYSHFRAGGATWDGIIGYQVLSSRRSALNYRTRELKFW